MQSHFKKKHRRVLHVARSLMTKITTDIHVLKEDFVKFVKVENVGYVSKYDYNSSIY